MGQVLSGFGRILPVRDQACGWHRAQPGPRHDRGAVAARRARGRGAAGSARHRPPRVGRVARAGAAAGRSVVGRLPLRPHPPRLRTRPLRVARLAARAAGRRPGRPAGARGPVGTPPSRPRRGVLEHRPQAVRADQLLPPPDRPRRAPREPGRGGPPPPQAAEAGSAQPGPRPTGPPPTAAPARTGPPWNAARSMSTTRQYLRNRRRRRTRCGRPAGPRLPRRRRLVRGRRPDEQAYGPSCSSYAPTTTTNSPNSAAKPPRNGPRCAERPASSSPLSWPGSTRSRRSSG